MKSSKSYKNHSFLANKKLRSKVKVALFDHIFTVVQPYFEKKVMIKTAEESIYDVIYALSESQKAAMVINLVIAVMAI